MTKQKKDKKQKTDMRKWILTQCFTLLSLALTAQTYSGTVFDEEGRGLEGVSVVVTDSASHTLGFGYSALDGSFSVAAKAVGVEIQFSAMGFERLSIPTKGFRSGQHISLKAKDFVLKEVKVRPDKITQTDDTLTFNVAQFVQGQDRSIADVIKRMPGLEVSASGQISFEGKPINKFYIEGMDLMGGKYAQASENLQAGKVKDVQVVQNHQPVKSLRGIQFSEQAALNIVLKDEAKNAWAKTADVGVGRELGGEGPGGDFLYDGRLMAMIFSRRRQNLSMYKANNSGRDIAHEVADLSSLLRGRQEMDGLLQPLTVSAPDLDEQRTNFNTSHTVATNELVRTSRGNDLRIQADWLWNRQRSGLFSETEYTDLGGIRITEESAVSTIDNRLEISLTYKINKEKTYLQNQLHGYMDFDRSFGSTVLNGVEKRQEVRPRKRYLTEDFETLKTLRNGNVLNFSSQTTYSNLPGRLLTVLGQTERLELSGLESRNTLSFRQRIRAFTIKYEAGFSLKSQRMEVEMIAADEMAKAADDVAKAPDEMAKVSDDVAKAPDDMAKAADDVAKAADDVAKCAASASPSVTPHKSVGTEAAQSPACALAYDSFSYNQQNIFLTPSVNFECGPWKMNASVKADLLNASSLSGRRPSSPGGLRLTLQPQLSAKYSVSGTTALQTTYSYTEAVNSLTTLFRTPVFTSYRTMTSHTGRFCPSGKHQASIALNYKQPVRGNFLTVEGTVLRRTNNILYQSQLQGNIYLRTPTSHRYDANTFQVRAHLSKSLYWAKTSLSLTATQNWSGYALLIGNSVTDWQMESNDIADRVTDWQMESNDIADQVTNWQMESNDIADQVTNWQMETSNITVRLSMAPTRIFSYELSTELTRTRQKQVTQKTPSPPGEGRGEALTTSTLSLNLFPTPNWELALRNTLFHSHDKTSSTTHFADAHLTYKNPRYELRLTAQNLLNHNTFKRQTINPTTTTRRIHTLRPTTLLLTLSLDL